MSARASDLKKITDNPKYDAEPIVSPDGQQIVFGSQRCGDFDIYLMNSGGSNVKRLTDRTGHDGGPWFPPGGTNLGRASNRNPKKPRATDVFIGDWLKQK